jgi:hypothetical protein
VHAGRGARSATREIRWKSKEKSLRTGDFRPGVRCAPRARNAQRSIYGRPIPVRACRANTQGIGGGIESLNREMEVAKSVLSHARDARARVGMIFNPAPRPAKVPQVHGPVLSAPEGPAR